MKESQRGQTNIKCRASCCHHHINHFPVAACLFSGFYRLPRTPVEASGKKKKRKGQKCNSSPKQVSRHYPVWFNTASEGDVVQNYTIKRKEWKEFKEKSLEQAGQWIPFFSYQWGQTLGGWTYSHKQLSQKSSASLTACRLFQITYLDSVR